MFTIKLTEKIPDPRNVKEQYQSFMSMKNTKSVQQLKIITQQPQTLKNSKIVDIKTVFTENPKTSHKLSKNPGQAEKVSPVDSNSYLNSGTKKVKIFRKLKI